MLAGDNGILQKTKLTNENTNEAGNLELIKLQVIASYDNNKNIDKTRLLSNLTEIGASVEDTDFPLLVTLNKKTYTVYDNGEINTVSDNALNISKINNIVSDSNITDEEKRDFYRKLYGKTVDYPVKITTEFTTNNGEDKGKWRIFYADENNIYLIADSRIKVPFNSEDTSQNEFLSGYITYSKWSGTFGTNTSNGIFPNYPVTNLDYNRTSPTIITKYASETILKKLNNSYYSQGFDPKSVQEGLDSLRAVISMLDTDVWSIFRDAKYAQYSIGGPSLEMFCQSYSQTHEQGVEAKAFAINGWGTQYGYKVRISGEEEYKYGTDNNIISTDLDFLYFKQSKMYWFCSACAQTDYARIFHMGRFGGINATYGADLNNTAIATGFRPIICLKSNVQLEESTNLDYNYVLK